jgi:hypothetical protein
MWKPALTIKVFGIYSLVMGGVLFFIPHLILPVFGLNIGSEESWLRLLGFVLCCSSYYYLRMSGKNSLDFARFTTHTRFAAPIAVVLLIAMGKADWHFLSFGIVDGIGGLWTWYALRRQHG